jgi:hypothetical protein
MENIPAIKDVSGRLVTDSIEKANTLNIYYSSVFSRERSIPQIQHATSGKPFIVSTKIIRKRLEAIGKNKSVGPDGISGEILKLVGEAMIPYLVRLLDVTVNNAAIASDWKKAIVVPICKGGDRSLVSNYRPVSLTSVVCKQMEHIVASYLRKYGIKRIGYLMVSMDSSWDIHVKVRYSQFIKTLRTRWITEVG